jgi:hypothetical protein
MRTGIFALLAVSLLAGTRPRIAEVPVSRIENQAAQPWKLILGKRVAGIIRIRPTGTPAGAAKLEGEGEAYVIQPGQSVDMAVLPTRDSLALEVVFSKVDGSGSTASIYISQGNRSDPHTLNINESPSVSVDRTCYGRSGNGPFVRIR